MYQVWFDLKLICLMKIFREVKKKLNTTNSK